MNKLSNLKLVIGLSLALLFFSCSSDDSPIQPPNDTTNISKIEDVLNGTDNDLKNLLNKVRGSVGKAGLGSKVVWSKKNDFGLGLYVSAHHVLGLDIFPNRDEQHIDLLSNSDSWGVFVRSQLPPTNGDIMFDNMLIADYILYQSQISSNATNTTIVPSEDFYLGIVDNQRVENNGLAQYPESIQTDEPLTLYDPDDRTTANVTMNTAIAGENAIVVGYPHNTDDFPNGAVGYAKILSDAEAQTTITQLQEANDEEGDIPYNPEVEFFVQLQGTAGMSGSGVFNNEGELLGILVRGSTEANAPKIIRVVRMTYIKQKLMTYYNSLDQSEKDELEPFISGVL